MEKAKRTLVGGGFDEKNIHTKMEAKKHGVARDIVAEAKEGYDMIIMGRRGLSGIKEMFLGSVSQKVISLAKDISVSVIE
jgi:nucleotide-binding universal stress UspA family protein